MKMEDDLKDLKRKTVLGIGFKFLERAGTQIIGIAISIILARILEPEVVGIVSLAEVFVLFFGVLATYGFGNSLIQNNQADEVDYSTGLYCSLILSILLYAIIYLTAPIIEDFYGYHQIQFALIIRVLGISIFFSAIRSVLQAIVSKKMLFNYFMYAALFSLSISGILGIIIAINGGGIWALVIQNTLMEILYVAILEYLLRWKMNWKFSFKSAKKIFDYGWKLVVVGLLNVTYMQLRSLIIAKKYSSTDLAYYNRGYKFSKIVPEELGATLMAVLFPVFSIYDSKEQIKTAMRNAVRISMYIVSPVLIGMLATANNIVEFVLTEKWIEVTVYMRVFCISYLLYVVQSIICEAIKAIGNSRAVMHINLISKFIGVVCLIYASAYGAISLALSFMFAMLIESFLYISQAKKYLNYSLKECVYDWLPSLSLSLVMGIVCYYENSFDYSSGIKLLIQIITGIAVYMSLSQLFELKTYLYIKKEVIKILKK